MLVDVLCSGKWAIVSMNSVPIGQIAACRTYQSSPKDPFFPLSVILDQSNHQKKILALYISANHRYFTFVFIHIMSTFSK